MGKKEKYEVPLLLKLVQISMNSYLINSPVGLDQASHEDFLCQFGLHCCILSPCCNRHMEMLRDIYLALYVAQHRFLQVLVLVIYDLSLRN